MAKVFVIGDIHGAYKALEQVFERAGVDKDVDTVISLGDVADGWSQVPECVELLLEVKNLIPIRGNHDEWAYEWMKFRGKNHQWLTQGGQATYDAYVKRHPELIEKHLDEFFSNQHYYFHDKDNDRVFVHGGYVSASGIGLDTAADYIWDRELWSLAMIGETIIRGAKKAKKEGGPVVRHIPRRLRPHKEIFIGHTTTMLWGEDYPMHKCNVWNMDTGAGWHGKLSIMDVDTKEIWQSDPVQELYPNELGRK